MHASGGVVGEGKIGVRVLSCEVLVDVRGGQPPRRTGKPGIQSPVEEGVTGVRVLSSKVLVVVRLLSSREDVVVRGGQPPRRTGSPGMQIEEDTLVDEEKTGVRVLSSEVLVLVRVLSWTVDVVVRGGHPPRRTGKPGMQIGREIPEGLRVDSDEVLKGVVVVRVRSEVVVVEGACVVVVVVGQPPSLTGRPGIHGSRGVDVVVIGAGVVVVSVVVVVERGQPPSPSGRPGMQGLTVVEVGSAVGDVEEGELRDQTGQSRRANRASKRSKHQPCRGRATCGRVWAATEEVR